MLGRWFNASTIAFGLLGALLILISETTGWMTGAFALLVREVGFALWVAIAVFILFELRSREEFEASLQRKFDDQRTEIGGIITKQDERLDTQVASIASNVFFGVYKRNLPAGLIDEASRVVLEQDVFKRDIFVRYSFLDRSFRTGDGVEVPFVGLAAALSFNTTNISSRPIKVPIGIWLPNPITGGMIEQVAVNQCSWRLEKDASYSQMDAATINQLNRQPTHTTPQRTNAEPHQWFRVCVSRPQTPNCFAVLATLCDFGAPRQVAKLLRTLSATVLCAHYACPPTRRMAVTIAAVLKGWPLASLSASKIIRPSSPCRNSLMRFGSRLLGMASVSMDVIGLCRDRRSQATVTRGRSRICRGAVSLVIARQM